MNGSSLTSEFYCLSCMHHLHIWKKELKSKTRTKKFRYYGIVTCDIMDNFLRRYQKHVVVIKEEDLILFATLVGLVLEQIV